MAAPRYRSISAIGNRVTVVACRAVNMLPCRSSSTECWRASAQVERASISVAKRSLRADRGRQDESYSCRDRCRSCRRAWVTQICVTWDVLCVLLNPPQDFTPCRAGARPGHPIKRHMQCSKLQPIRSPRPVKDRDHHIWSRAATGRRDQPHGRLDRRRRRKGGPRKPPASATLQWHRPFFHRITAPGKVGRMTPGKAGGRTHGPHRRLLCARRERPHGCRAAEQRDIQGGQNSFRSLAMSTGPEKCFFTSSAQVE
jgi:hypothetical protein